MGGNQGDDNIPHFSTEEQAEVYTKYILYPFSEAEAQAKVERRVKTLEAWLSWQVEKGTLGTVIAVVPLRQRFTEKIVFAVLVQWDDCYFYGGEPCIMDFNKVDYEDFLVEVDQ